MQGLHPDDQYRMVITASAMGKLSLPGYALYSSTKSALDGFADGYRFETDRPQQIALVYWTRTRFLKGMRLYERND